MIKALVTRGRSIHQSAACWLSNRFSRSSRVTLRTLLVIGCVSLLLGALLLCVMAMAGYQFIDRGKLTTLSPSASGNLSWVFQYWTMILLLIFGGDSLRSRAHSELRRRRSYDQRAKQPPTATQRDGAPNPVVGGAQGLTSSIINFVVAPILLFWAILCFISNLTWLRSNLPPGGLGIQIWRIPWFVGYDNFQNLCLWWILTSTLFVAGVGMWWTGIRSLFWRTRSSR